jgi:hypothetical protein
MSQNAGGDRGPRRKTQFGWLKEIRSGFFGAAIALILAIGYSHYTRTASVTEQIAEITAAAQRANITVDAVRTGLHLHPDVPESVVFVFRPPVDRYGFSNRSYQVRIYDLHDARLRLEWQFEPKTWKKTPFDFAIDGIEDIGQTGSPLVVGVFGAEYADAHPNYPVALHWDTSRSRYEITGVDISDEFTPRPYSNFDRIRLEDHADPHRAVVVNGSEEFILRRSGPDVLGIANYVMKARDRADPTLYGSVVARISVFQEFVTMESCLPSKPGIVTYSARPGSWPLVAWGAIQRYRRSGRPFYC